MARYPDTRPVWQPNHRWRLYGERDAVGVTVIVKRDGGIWAACGRKTSMACGRWPEPVNGALVDLLVASLGSSGAPVSAEERGELRSLLAAMDMPDAPLAGLAVQG